MPRGEKIPVSNYSCQHMVIRILHYARRKDPKLPTSGYIQQQAMITILYIQDLKPAFE